MTDVLILSTAERELTEALCWYTERSRVAAERFLDEFQRALDAIATDPRRFPRCDEVHRFYLMRRSPYQLIYRPESDRVLVVAVAHTSRKPGYWSNR